MTTAIIQTAAAVQTKSSRFIGAVGDRVHLEGVVRKMFGSKPTLHIIEDIDGNQFEISRRSVLASKPGVLVTIEANVTGHKTYQGIKRTVLSPGSDQVVTEDHAFRRKRSA